MHKTLVLQCIEQLLRPETDTIELLEELRKIIAQSQTEDVEPLFQSFYESHWHLSNEIKNELNRWSFLIKKMTQYVQTQTYLQVASKPPAPHQIHLNQLPPEILHYKLFPYLFKEDIVQLSRTNRFFRQQVAELKRNVSLYNSLPYAPRCYGFKPQAATLRGHREPIGALIVLPNGLLVSGAEDSTIRVWQLKRPGRYRCVQVLQGHISGVVAIVGLPNNQFASGSYDHTIRIWEVGHKGYYRCAQNLKNAHGKEILAMAALPNGVFLSSARDHTLQVWHPDQQSQYHRIQAFQNEHTTRIDHFLVLPNHLVVSKASLDTISLWRFDEQNHCHNVRTLSQDAPWLHTITVLSSDWWFFASGTWGGAINVWIDGPAWLEGRDYYCVQMRGAHTDGVTALAALPNDGLASGSIDTTIKIWQLNDKGLHECIQTLKASQFAITQLVVLPQGALAHDSGEIEKTTNATSLPKDIKVWQFTRLETKLRSLFFPKPRSEER